MSRKSPDRGHDIRALRLPRNRCFVCGPDNAAGMHLKFTYDKTRNRFVCRFRLDERYTGPPGHCHGGIIATILDEAMGKVNKLRNVIALTSQMTVDYLKPVPLNKPLRVESRDSFPSTRSACSRSLRRSKGLPSFARPGRAGTPVPPLILARTTS